MENIKEEILLQRGSYLQKAKPINSILSIRRDSPSTKKSESPQSRRSSSCSSIKEANFSSRLQEIDIGGGDRFMRKRPSKLTHFFTRKSSSSIGVKKSLSSNSLETTSIKGSLEVSTNDFFYNRETETRYEILEQVGKGNQAKVFKVQTSLDPTDIDSQKTLIAKVLFKMDDDEHRSHFDNEYNILMKLNHENIVKVHSIFEDDRKTCIVLIEDLIEGESLRKLIETGADLKETEILTIMKQITQAMIYIHENKIVHRDLTVDNIIYNTETKKVTIIDFGIAVETSPSLRLLIEEEKKFGDELLEQNSQFIERPFLMSAMGMPCYRAPEMIKGDNYDEKIDIWMSGLVFLQLTNSTLKIKTKKILKRIKQLGHVEVGSSRFETLIEKMLVISPYDRIAAREMLLYLN